MDMDILPAMKELSSHQALAAAEKEHLTLVKSKRKRPNGTGFEGVRKRDDVYQARGLARDNSACSASGFLSAEGAALWLAGERAKKEVEAGRAAVAGDEPSEAPPPSMVAIGDEQAREF